MHDYIVVGAGSAGAILAARLSENPGRRVLLLEAGPDYADESAMPADLLDAKNLPGLDHDWLYTATAVEGRTIPYRRGKMVGGTSAINAAAALWAQPADFDAWAKLGNPQWHWSDVAPWFQRLECDPHGSAKEHGRAGPIPISRYDLSEFAPIQRAFYDACRVAGFPPIEDHNAPGAWGVGAWPMNRSGDKRMSTLLSHVNPARGRKNLTIRPGCLVDRLLVDGKRVHGVSLSDGITVEAGTVILCAGAIGSPAILMRSGIGPRQELAALGIDAHLDLPGVGARLWDHAAVPILLVPNDGESVIGRDPRFQVMARYTAPGSAEPDDMQLVMVTHVDLRTAPALAAAAGVPVVAALVSALMVARGHGKLTLTSRDPAVQPRIDLNYGADPEDLRRLMDGVRRAWTLLHSTALAGAYRSIVGLTEDIVVSEDRLKTHIRANIGTYCHALGTAPIGPDDDPYAVLDQQCRLRGADNLYVVDASVFPAVPRVVPNFTVMMLAERVAAWLAASR